MEEVWQCNCPICRFTVKPLLRIIGRKFSLQNIKMTKEVSATKSTEKNIREIAKKYPVQTVKVPSQTTQEAIVQKQIPTIQPQAEQQNQVTQQNIVAQLQSTVPQPQQVQPQQTRTQSSEEKKEERKEEKETRPQQTVRVEIPKEVMERINSLETEVEKMKKYVKLSIDSIKATLVDLRSAMAELSNPFNILRKYADIFFGGEEGEKEKKGKETATTQTQQQYPNTPLQYIPIVIPAMPQQLVPTTQNMMHQFNSLNNIDKSVVENKDAISKEGKEITKVETRPKIPFDVYEKLVLWANNVLNKIDRNRFTKLVDYYIDIGVLTEDIGRALKKIVELVDELRKSGIDPKEQIRLLRDLLSGIDKTNEYSKADTEYQENYSEYHVEESLRKAKKEESVTSEAARELLDLIEGGG